MNRIWLCIILCSIFLGFALNAVAVDSAFTLSPSRAQEYTITFTHPSYTITDANGRQQVVLNDHPDATDFTAQGMADLPSFSHLVALPEGYSAQGEWIPLRTRTYNNYHPVVAGGSRASQTSAVQPAISCSPVQIFGPKAVTRVVFKPYTYTPQNNQLLVIEEAELHITLIPTRSTPTPPSTRFTRSEGELYRNLVLDPNPPRSEYRPGCYVLVYSGDADVRTTLNNFVVWKKQLGYEVRLVSTTETGSGATAIRNYLINAYNTWTNPPEYVLLVGDVDGDFRVPTFNEYYLGYSVAGDHPYACLAGDDILPEVSVGRFSFESVTELSTMINRTKRYEQTTHDNGAWLSNNLLVGDAGQSGVSTIMTMQWIKNMMSAQLPIDTFTEVYSEPFASAISDGINNGTGTVFYRGFAGCSGWDNNDVGALEYTGMFPLACFITCNTGMFASSGTSLIEKLLRVGTPSAPKGAVTAIGSSSQTHTCFNNIITAGYAQGLYLERLAGPGPALMRGKLALYENYPDNPEGFRDWYTIGKNLMGDPGLRVFGQQPKSCTVVAPASMPAQGGSLQITVTAATNTPLSGALVTVYANSGDYVCSVNARSDGLAVFDLPALTGSEINYTVQFDDYAINRGSITLNTTTGIAVTGIVPASTGQFLRPGTDYSFRLTLHNSTSQAIAAGTATIIASNDAMAVNTAQATYTAIQPGQDGQTGLFTVHPDTNMTNGSTVHFLVNNGLANNITGAFTLTVAAPVAILSTPQASPSPAPGASFSLICPIQNNNTAVPFLGGSAVLRCSSPFVTISDSLADYVVNNNSVTNASSPFALNFNWATPNGYDVPFTLIYHDGLGVGTTYTLPFTIRAGTAQNNSPTGPDQFGHWFYDQGDPGSLAPTYAWHEINPVLGGQGTVLDLQDTDTEGSGAWQTVDLPFPLVFYGTSYNRLTVSSNGYVCPGEVQAQAWMNYHLPSPTAPVPMIAPFWDDLLTNSNSRICIYYSRDMHVYIVEWSHMELRYDHSEETFQLVIYDNAYTQTGYGDNLLVFNYNNISNSDFGYYTDEYVDHGEYCTVGISAPNHTEGLTYTYAGINTAGAVNLANQTSLSVSSAQSLANRPLVTVTDYNYTDAGGDGFIDNGDEVTLRLQLANRGIQDAGPISVTLGSDDPYLQLEHFQTSIAALPTQTGEWLSEELTFRVIDGCPNGYQLLLYVQLSYNGYQNSCPLTFTVRAPEAVFTSCTITEPINGQWSPGETAMVEFDVASANDLPIDTTAITASVNSPGFVITPAHFYLVNLTTSPEHRSFSITAPADSPQNANLTVTLTATIGNLVYNKTITTIFGQEDVCLNSDFSSSSLQGWNNITTNGITIKDSNTAGGAGPECIINPSWALVSKSYFAPGLHRINLSFKYSINGNTGDANATLWYGNSHEYHSEVFWHCLTPGQGAAHARCEVQAGDWTYCYVVFELMEGSQSRLALDDVIITQVSANTGHITGNISVPDGCRPEDTMILTDGSIWGVDTEGNYNIHLPAGTHTLRYQLPGCVTWTDDAFTIQDDTITEINHSFYGLSIPQHLTAEILDHQLTLNWEYEPETDYQLENFTVFCRTFYTESDPVLYSYISRNTTWSTTVNDDWQRKEYWVVANYRNLDSSLPSDTLTVLNTATHDPQQVTAVTALTGIYPNPFNPTTNIDFTLAQAERVKMQVFDSRGRLVKDLMNCVLPAGNHSQTWLGTNNTGSVQASGVYFIRMQTNGKSFTKKVLLLK